jgi:hypothetical protein
MVNTEGSNAASAASNVIPATPPPWFVEVWTEVRSMQQAIGKIPQLQESVKAVDDRVTDLDQRTTNAIEAVNAKVDAHIAHQAAQPAPVVPWSAALPPSFEDVLSRECNRALRLVDEANQMDGTVIIGKQPSAPDNLYSEEEVRKVVSTISGSGSTLAPRGASGSIFSLSFRKIGNHTPAIRAKNFLVKLGKMQASRVMWAQVDRPKELRDCDRRARSFARAFKAKVVAPTSSTRSPVFFTVEQGFLIINDTVIAPVTLIPSEDSWTEFYELVFDLIKNGKRNRVCKTKLYSLQLHKPIAKFLYEAFIAAPEDVELDEDEDEYMNEDEALTFDNNLEVQPPPVRQLGPIVDLLAPLDSAADGQRTSN